MKLKQHIGWIIGLNLACILVLIYSVVRYDFVDPLLLILTVLIPALSVYFFWKSEEYFGQLHLTQDESNGSLSLIGMLPKLFKSLTLFSLFLGLVALARPQDEMVPKDITKEGIDIIIALDVSLSMLAKDFEPDRLEASKRVAKEFVSERVNDRIGIVVYAAESFPRVPLTSDNQMVMNAIDDISNGKLVNGTAIGMGLASSVNRLKDSESKSKAVILLSDGENNAGQIEPEVASELAKAYGITVYTIGVGSEGTALSPSIDLLGRVTFREQEVRIDEQTLYAIAQKTGGKYFRATSEQKLKEIYNAIDQLEKTRFEATIIKQKRDVYLNYLAVSLGLLLLVFIFNYLIFKSLFD